jgi:nicotinic acid phosphoribosyltransferase
MKTYQKYGGQAAAIANFAMQNEGCPELPRRYDEFMRLSQQTRKLVGRTLPLVLSDNYEHFMACLPHRDFAAQHVLIRKQIGGFTTVAGFWKWLEFLSHRITDAEVDLTADFFSGKHNGYPRQFDKAYWKHVVRDFGGYMPLRIETIGEGGTFTGVPFPVAQVYGETPAVWANEPMYIQVGHLSYVATVAAQFASILGDPFRFIEVMFRALHNSDESDDVLLAMLIGGGIISTSNDFGAFVNGAPFKCAGTTAHAWYQQYETLKDALRALLSSPLGPYATVLLDVYDHKHGFTELMELMEEGLPAPFADRPDSGDTLAHAMHDLMAMQDAGRNINVVLEDGKRPKDVLVSENRRRQLGLAKDRTLYGGGGAFMGQRRDLEAAFKACLFHDGTAQNPTNLLETMKICLDDPMKQGIPGLAECFYNTTTGFYTVGERLEEPPQGAVRGYQVLYDNLTNPGEPYFDPAESRNVPGCQGWRQALEGDTRSSRTGVHARRGAEPNGHQHDESDTRQAQHDLQTGTFFGWKLAVLRWEGRSSFHRDLYERCIGDIFADGALIEIFVNLIRAFLLRHRHILPN